MSNTTLLKQAEDALDWLLKNIRRDAPQLSGKAMGNAEAVMKAIQEALAQQGQGEPVAWMWQHDETGQTGFLANGGANSREWFEATNPRLKIVAECYTAPQPLPSHHDEIQEAVKAGRVTFAPGWKLVPIEPTDAMISEALDCQEADPEDGLSGEVYATYKAMIGAAPSTAPQPADREPLTEAAKLLPHGYLFAKVGMVMPLFQEARDALTALTDAQRVVHGISKSLADRMDVAGTYSLDDWEAANGIKKGGA